MYIYQIEVSNICSLRCTYCPHPLQLRKKGFMSLEVFGKCVELFRMARNRNTLRLHNFGEVLMHPRLPEFIAYAKARGVECSFFTNGVRPGGSPYSRSYWQQLANAGLRTVDFSSHVISLEEFMQVTDGVIEIGREFNPRTRVLGSWAGQTGPPETPVSEPCIFERQNALVVLWDGRISSCCLDVEGRRSELWIDDVLRQGSYCFEAISLCSSCASMRHHEDL